MKGGSDYNDGDIRPFIVACHGWSASNWVAYVLNLHPEIACAHSSAAVLAVDPRHFDGDNLRRRIPALRKGYVQRQNRSIDDIYAGVLEQKQARYVGSVHTFRLRDLPLQAERFGPFRHPFRTVNLVRHPLDLVVSGYGQFKDLFRVDINEFAWTLRKIVDGGLEIVEDICDRYNLAPGDYNCVCFFGACAVLGSLRLDLDAVTTPMNEVWGYQGVARMEDVTRSPEAFESLLERITGCSNLFTEAYRDTVFQTSRINVHNFSAEEGTIHRWGSLSAWQREAFSSFFKRFDIRLSYERYGYDFSFMDE